MLRTIDNGEFQDEFRSVDRGDVVMLRSGGPNMTVKND
jgi:Uncharacterized small protein (DUF2158)